MVSLKLLPVLTSVLAFSSVSLSLPHRHEKEPERCGTPLALPARNFSASTPASRIVERSTVNLAIPPVDAGNPAKRNETTVRLLRDPWDWVRGLSRSNLTHANNSTPGWKVRLATHPLPPVLRDIPANGDSGGESILEELIPPVKKGNDLAANWNLTRPSLAGRSPRASITTGNQTNAEEHLCAFFTQMRKAASQSDSKIAERLSDPKDPISPAHNPWVGSWTEKKIENGEEVEVVHVALFPPLDKLDSWDPRNPEGEFADLPEFPNGLVVRWPETTVLENGEKATVTRHVRFPPAGKALEERWQHRGAGEPGHVKRENEEEPVPRNKPPVDRHVYDRDTFKMYFHTMPASQAGQLSRPYGNNTSIDATFKRLAADLKKTKDTVQHQTDNFRNAEVAADIFGRLLKLNQELIDDLTADKIAADHDLRVALAEIYDELDEEERPKESEVPVFRRKVNEGIKEAMVNLMHKAKLMTATVPAGSSSPSDAFERELAKLSKALELDSKTSESKSER